MASVAKHTTRHHANSANSASIHAATALLGDGKKLVNKIYKDGLHTMDWAEKGVGEVSSKLSKKVKDNPIASVCIAAGIGYILSALLRK